jgi:hypothetical protein
MPWSVQQFIDNTRMMLDGESSERWTDPQLKSLGGIIMLDEWSGILNANPYYRMARVPVTTDSQGRVPIAALTTGTGDSAQNFYRLHTITDGNILWRETDLRYVPMGAITNYQNPYEYLFYLTGDFYQLLPVTPAIQVFCDVNWRPPTLDDLSALTAPPYIDFPNGYEWILAWITAGSALMKGGAETQAASDLFAWASDARRNMLGDVGRRSLRPTQALYVDSPAAWAG